MMFKKLLLLVFITLITGPSLFAQWEISEDEQFYRIRVWRRIDLRDKQNKGFFARGKEVTKFILEGINSGEITEIYRTDDLVEKVTKDEFLGGIQKQAAQAVTAYDPNVTYEFGENVKASDGNTYSSIQPGNYGFEPSDPLNVGIYWSLVDPTSLSADLFNETEFAIIEVIEDVIFDKRRSRLFYDIEAITLMVPGDIMINSPLATNTDTPFGVIKYDEIEKMFRNNPEAKWINRYNPKEWKNFADAFLLRLFNGPIIRYENPDGLKISDLFPDNHFEAVLEMSRYEMFLMEKEHNLWEY